VFRVNVSDLELYMINKCTILIIEDKSECHKYWELITVCIESYSNTIVIKAK